MTLCWLVTVLLAGAGGLVPLLAATLLLDAAEATVAGLVTEVLTVVVVDVCDDGAALEAVTLV